MLASLLLLSMAKAPQITIVDKPAAGLSPFYGGSRAPLAATPFVKLPISAFTPAGWLRTALERQRDGLTGHLGEISIWLTKKNNAWLNPSGTGDYGWEEVPYWLRGYARIGYALRDPKMLAETKVWIDGTLSSSRPDGDFGPIHNHGLGFRDLWAQMLMLQVLQSWYEYSADPRVLPFMTRYFRWQSRIPDAHFLKDYWENSRGGDNLASVYWLYNRTGDSFLLDLATKIDRNTANWRRLGDLPNYHNVNIAEGFREPATYFLQSHNPADLVASYRDFDFIREKFGQVPGGMFGADENARPGHDDPHQATETCGFVEQIGSNALMTEITGDPKWSANTEDVAFNSLPAALTPDYRALRYLTAPNMVVSDAKDHAPGLANGGPFLLMNPFSSRCCQHNSASAWVNYLESSWMATPDHGLAALLLHAGVVTAKVGAGQDVSLETRTNYPFDGSAEIEVRSPEATTFPLYIRIPEWAGGATVSVDGIQTKAAPGRYVRIEKEWSGHEAVKIRFPMKPRVQIWSHMRDSASVVYGPLTFSLKIGEEYRQIDTKSTAISDSGWQPNADASLWPSYEILPKTAWNFGLVEAPTFKVVKRPWPSDGYPFTLANSPLEIVTQGKKIPSWGMDETGLVAILPKSPAETPDPVEPITLVPMGAARLRISSFPTVRR